MNKSVEILLSAFSTAAAAKLLPEIEKVVSPPSLALVLTALSGAFLFVVLRLIYSVPMRFPQIRRYLDGKYGIEGYWFEVVDNAPTHQYSFAWIRYSTSTGTFMYKGRNFNSDMTTHARWFSSAIVTDDKSDRIHFLFEADLVKGPESIRGHGVLEFAHQVGRVFTSGSGSFIDTGIEMKRRTFSAERISGQYVKSVIGKTTIETDDDIYKVMRSKISEHESLSPPHEG